MTKCTKNYTSSFTCVCVCVCVCLYIICNKKYNGKNKKKLQKYTIPKLGKGVVILAHFYKMNK